MYEDSTLPVPCVGRKSSADSSVPDHPSSPAELLDNFWTFLMRSAISSWGHVLGEQCSEYVASPQAAVVGLFIQVMSFPNINPKGFQHLESLRDVGCDWVRLVRVKKIHSHRTRCLCNPFKLCWLIISHAFSPCLESFVFPFRNKKKFSLAKVLSP